MGLAGVAQVVRHPLPHPKVRQGRVTKQTDDVRFAVTPIARGSRSATLAATGPRPLEHRKWAALSPGSDPGRRPLPRAGPHRGAQSVLFRSLAIFLFKAQSRPKPANTRCPTLSATFTANLGASSADSPSAGMKSKSDRHTTGPGTTLRGADPRTLPRPPPPNSKPGRHCLQGARPYATAHRAKPSSASCPPHPLPRSGDFGGAVLIRSVMCFNDRLFCRIEIGSAVSDPTSI